MFDNFTTLVGPGVVGLSLTYTESCHNKIMFTRSKTLLHSPLVFDLTKHDEN